MIAALCMPRVYMLGMHSYLVLYIYTCFAQPTTRSHRWVYICFLRTSPSMTAGFYCTLFPAWSFDTHPLPITVRRIRPIPELSVLILYLYAQA